MRRFIVLCVLVASIVVGCAPTTDVTTFTTPPAAEDSDTTSPGATITEPAPDQDIYVEARMAMVESQIEARGVTDPVVLQAMRTVPRHQFVSVEYIHQAYDDHPLPIGHGQTISQPYIVAWMSELLEVQAGDKVLEIGTGSGYQAAVLAEMGVEVYTIEIIAALADTAAAVLDHLGYQDVKTLEADGYFGWEEHAPYDAIIVTAAPDHVPQPLLLQLVDGGRLVIPVGPVGSYQTLWRFTFAGEDEVLAENLGFVRFVPFTRSESE